MTSTVLDELKLYLDNDPDACPLPGVEKAITRNINNTITSLRIYPVEKFSVFESMSSFDIYTDLTTISKNCTDKLREKIYYAPFNCQHYANAIVGTERISVSGDVYNLDQHFNACKRKLDYTHYESLNLSNDSLLFPGVRFISDNIVIFEMPPTNKHISYIPFAKDDIPEDEDDQEYNHYYVPIPWQIYIATYDPSTMRISDVSMYFSDTPLTSFDQPVYLPPLLNFYSNGLLCRPFFYHSEDIEKYPKNISGVIASAVDWVWNSGYNFDITESISEYISSGKFRSLIENSDLSNDELQQLTALYNLSPYEHVANNSLSPKVVSQFFTLWQSVPISKILSCKWISFCSTQNFFTYEYQTYPNQNHEESQKWVTENIGYKLISDEELEQRSEEDEDYDESDSCMTYGQLINRSDYRRWAYEKIHNSGKTIFHAYSRVHKHVASHPKIFMKTTNSYEVFNKFIINHFNQISKEIISSTSDV